MATLLAIAYSDEGTAEQAMQTVQELESELISWCRERLAGFKCPRTVEFTEALPRQDNGKLYKRLLRDRFCRCAPCARDTRACVFSRLR